MRFSESWRMQVGVSVLAGILGCAGAGCSGAPQAAKDGESRTKLVVATGAQGCSGTTTFQAPAGWKVDGDHLANDHAALYAVCDSSQWLSEHGGGGGTDFIGHLKASDVRCAEPEAIFEATVAGRDDGVVCDLGAADGHHWLSAMAPTPEGNALDVQVDLAEGDAAFRAETLDLIADLEYAPS